MADPVTSAGLAKDWIRQLLDLWAEVRRERRAEIEQIKSVFGDPELLAPFYVEPDCQPFNPADDHQDEPVRAFRQPIRDWLNRFLKGSFQERDGRNTVFLLADAGMGKSSLLMMLRLTHLSRLWPSELHFVLLKLGPETLEEVAALGERDRTVLLLDALDEDPTAWTRIEERLAELLRAGESFRQVVITCRTQFFPKVGEAPIEQAREIEVAGYVCNLLYLSPFSDEQVEAYLRRVVPNRVADRIRKWLRITRADNPRLERARGLVLPMDSLKMRPILLAHVRDLMEADVERWTTYRVYRALVGNWLLREERKLEGQITREVLWEACRSVAMALQARGTRELGLDDLRQLLELHPVAEHVRELDVGGRSLLNRTSGGSLRFVHYSIQEFLVADALIEGWGMDAQQEARLRMTDQILGFLYSWIEEDPASRLVQVPWSSLELRDWRLEHCGLALRSADLAGVDLRGALLPNADLRGADLRGADLRDADLHGADLRDADLHGADLRDADLHGADLRDADLRGADRRGTRLDGARLAGAILQDLGEPFTEPLTGARFLWIPGGSFQMGGTEYPDEQPTHEVRVSPFWLAETPVTNRQYRVFLEHSGHDEPAFWSEPRFSASDQPVVGVSWHDASAFCRWLAEATGLPLALPTEAQWEFAARGTESRDYPWGSQPPDAPLPPRRAVSSRACFDLDAGNGQPAPVGSFPDGAGPFGTLDQAGNVWEWCADSWDEKAYQKRAGSREVVDPVVQGKDDASRVRRGGGWNNPAVSLRAAYRYRSPAGSRLNYIGFRVLVVPASL